MLLYVIVYGFRLLRDKWRNGKMSSKQVKMLSYEKNAKILQTILNGVEGWEDNENQASYP